MGRIKKNKPKPRPKVVIDYPPVPTKKWIPPDKRPKSPPPEPKYVKPEGITQKLAISTLKKVWNKYEVYGDAAILTGHFSQFHRRFSFKSNGFQGACNSAVACAYSEIYKMASWTKQILDEILIKGDELYVRSTQQGDKCLIEVPPEKMHSSFFLGNRKITLYVSPNDKVAEELTSASEEKAKKIIVNALEIFLGSFKAGILYIKEKYAAIWVVDGKYHYFNPGEHDELGGPWSGIPGWGVSFLGRFKTVPALVEYLYKNFPSMKDPYAKFHIIPCGIARVVVVDTTPPETFEDLAPKEIEFSQIIDEPPPLPNLKQDALKSYVEEDKEEIASTTIKMTEMSPDVGADFDEDKRPSFLPEGKIEKGDICRYPIPVPRYFKGEQARLTYYTDVIPKTMGILRGSTCQTNPKFSKYGGRQSMGNAVSALIMLRFYKAKHWIPKIVDTVLKNGDILFRDAMISIPRTHTLRLSDFPKKIEYEGRHFSRDIDEYAVVGQMQSQDFDILDLKPALDEFLTDHDCCIILGPQILAVWIEDGLYYMFDPNDRDQEGKAILKKTVVGSNVVDIEQGGGVACVVWCKNLQDLVDLYVNNTKKTKRSDRFYLSKVIITDYVEVSENWNNFKGIDINKWILRGTFSQASIRFSPESRNIQGPANAFMALAMSTLLDEKEWSKDTVDEILMGGDKFYKESVEYLQEKDLFTKPNLMLAELKKSLRFRDKAADFELDECIENGLIYAKDTNDLSDLRKGLESFFKDNDAGVLTTREISLPIWKKNEVYYYLDPYSRDEKGVATGYGTSCAIRLIHLDDLASAVEANLEPNTEDIFNLTKVKVTLYEAGEEGIVKPALNNYTPINEKCAILRSWLSEKDEKYEVRGGRQTVPMCITAAGFNKLKPAVEWTKNDLDNILDKGDSFYIESMAEIHKNLDSEERVIPVDTSAEAEEPAADTQGGGDAKPIAIKESEASEGNQAADNEEGEGEDEEMEEKDNEEPELEVKITSENVKRQFNIGPNNISVDFADVADGNIKESLKSALKDYFEEEQTDENFYQESLLETKSYTVALWRDDKAYYVFDPAPRDKNGQVIGKDDWDSEPEEEPEQEEDEKENKDDEEGEVTVTKGYSSDGNDYQKFMQSMEEGEEEEEDSKGDGNKVDADADEEEDEDTSKPQQGNEGEVKPEVGVEKEEEGLEEESKEEVKPPKPKKSPSYWSEQEKSGRACTIWFTNLEEFVDFVYDNIPIMDRVRSNFTLKGIKVVNNLVVKSKFNPEDERVDAYSGDWYDFKEVEHGKWILRASLDITHELFPEQNRGKQGLTCSIMALGIAHTFEITCFVDSVPDTILVYGDKLFTFMKRTRKKQLLSDPNTTLKEDEIDWLVQHEDFKITDIPKKICVSKFMIDVTIEPNAVVGDIKAQDFEDILDVEKGLQKFFQDSFYGVLISKNVYVAVWKGQKVFFMFDGMKRGPNGIQSTIGTGCITRYLSLDKMADVFLQNLPVAGKNEFFIHKVKLSRGLCPREREPQEVIPKPKSVAITAGMKQVVPGKSIIRGSISQEDPRFGKGPNVMSAPIAVIALTMSLIHKPETWSRPIVDDIVILGSELYVDSVNDLGFDFNPYDDRLDIYRVNKDYKIGVIKANCEFRPTDQRGLIDVKEADTQNLRQGMEHFFEENTHGILVTESLTVAIWEQKQDEGEPLIYVFDPNPRSSTGMPLFAGTACVMSFVNAKMASDHIIGCILDPALRVGPFVISPVEIVVGNVRTRRKQPEKVPTRSSINVLPRCSKQVANEQKRRLRKLAEEKRRRKEAKKMQMIGRNGYHLKGNEALLRGFKSQNSEYYNPESRDKQDIPNCIASVVMHSVMPIDEWNYRHIDLILDTGDQLYIDSYIAYGPQDPKLGMENILRKFLMGHIEVHVTVYKPIVFEVFTPSKLKTVLEAFFQQESVCILNYTHLWISVFFKGGYYFMFDPHERDINGNRITNEARDGTGVVVRFDCLDSMALKIVNNLGGNTDDSEMFSLWILSVESK